jgi:shikimate dehydrogenase
MGAAFSALGLPHSYDLVDCPDLGSLSRAVGQLAQGRLQGANVTIPHKTAVLSLVDQVHESAERVGAANVLAWHDAKTVAYNTDALALVERFRAHEVSSGAALVLGSGGAARAAAYALGQVGMHPVVVVARRFNSAAGRSAFALPGAEAVAPDYVAAALGGAPVRAVVQATSAGMVDKDPAAPVLAWVPWALLTPTALCLDVVYVPKVTEFMQAAGRRGFRVEGGAQMLAGQAAHALFLWLGVDPPREDMVRAVLEEA